MNSLIRSMDRFFEDWGAPPPFAAAAAEQRFTPACDVNETEGHYLLSFDLPGMTEKDVKIEWVDDHLIVSGERKGEDRENVRFSERAYGAFKRVFAVPTHVDADKIEAEFKDGVLRIAVPKAEATKPTQIRIGAKGAGLLSGVEGQGAA